MCVDPMDLEGVGCWTLGVLHAFWLLDFICSLFPRVGSLSLEGRDSMETSLIKLSVLRSPILYIMYVFEYLYLFPSVARGSFSDDG